MDDDFESYICHDCIGDQYIKKSIKQTGTINKCHYCNKKRKSINLTELVNWVDGIFNNYYKQGDEYPVPDYETDKIFWHTEGSPLDEIIANLLQVENEIVSDIVANLDNDIDRYLAIKDGDTPFYDNEMNYTPIEIERINQNHSNLWIKFCNIVKHQKRFFSEEVVEILNDIFSGLKQYRCFDEELHIRNINPDEKDSTIYRARRAISEKDRIKICLDPVNELGPPPPNKAIAGRMNPSGISVFYAAFERETCIAELRLPVGETAISGEFKVIKSIKVLDLTKFHKLYAELSYFDPDFPDKASRLDFLRHFENQISQVILKSDNEIEYIPTQAFIEYLANHFQHKIDAVIYSSSQNKNGKNIVLLNHVAKIKQNDQKEKTISKTPKYKENWYEDFYTIWEESERSTKEENDNDLNKVLDNDTQFDFDTDNNYLNEEIKTPYLSFVPDSLEIHKVNQINPTIESTSVSIYNKNNKLFNDGIIEL